MTQREKKMSWNLKHLFESDNDPKMNVVRKEFETAYSNFEQKWRNNKEFLEKASELKKALDDYETIIREYDGISKEGMYWILKNVQNQSDENVKSKKTEVIDFATTQGNKIEFFLIELSKVPKEKQKQFLQTPELLKYKHFLEKLFDEAKFILSEKEEKVVSKLNQSYYGKWTDMTREFLAKESRVIVNDKGKKERVNFENLLSLIGSEVSERLRDSAAKHLHSIQKKLAPIATHELNAILLSKKILMN